MHRRETAGEDGSLGKAQDGAEHRQKGEQRHRPAVRDPRDDGDARDREDGPQQGGEPQPLLAVEDGEQQRRERHEGEQRLPEAGMDLNERVVREAERAAKDERAVEQHAQQRSPSWKREPHDGHHCSEQARGEQETKPGTPERIELTIADPDADGVAARKQRPDDERRKRSAVPAFHGAKPTRLSPWRA